jgi:DNA-3-methyladenine glycosylase
MTTPRRRPASPLRKRLRRNFYARPALIVAPELLGTILVRRVGDELRRARIIEVEAYLGPKDLASHSSKGRTARTEVMFGPPGHAYVYFIYGMHFMLNFVVGTEGEAQAILIRGAEPLDGWEVDLTGPGRIARAFGVARRDNGLDLNGDDIYLVADESYRSKIVRRKRVGVDYARHWASRLLRFIDAGNPAAKRLRFDR